MFIPLLVVDAFTSNAFAGNPAAVALLPEPRSEGWMQAVATEMNLSETAFPVPRSDGAFDLRWFTPASEIDLCGHATLAAAHAIWERGVVPGFGPIVFHTASGILRVSRAADGWLEMDFPRWHFERVEARGPAEGKRAAPADAVVTAGDLARALGVEPVEAWRRDDDWLILVGDAAAVRGASPDSASVAALARMAIVTAHAGGVGVDFVSRTFVPRLGIPEDPVTGSAHCILAPFWAERLGRTELVGFQASRRGGTVRVRLEGERVAIGGQAVTVIRGELAG